MSRTLPILDEHCYSMGIKHYSDLWLKSFKITGILYGIGMLLCACTSETPEDGTRYQPFSTSVIKVTFDSAPQDTMYLEAMTINNIPHAGQKSEMIPIIREGNYFLSLINDRPTSATLNLNGQMYNIIIFPSDTVNVSVGTTGGEVAMNFSGKGATVNEYYQAKKNQLGYTDILCGIYLPMNLKVCLG